MAGIVLTGWLGFFLAIASLLIISHKNLGVAMFTAAIILGIFTIPESLLAVLFSSITNPSTIFLAIVVGVIPLIGTTLNETGQMDNLVKNLRIGKKPFLVLSPALVGLLPMPGGALLSAPLIEKVATDISREKKAGLNVWFRHILFIIYPISADLIVSTAAAQMDVYQPIPYLIPIFVFSLFLGYFFFLRESSSEVNYRGKFSSKGLILPLSALLIAPFLDVLLKTFFVLPIGEIGILIGVVASLIVAVVIGKSWTGKFSAIVWKAKPWGFAFMMFGIMAFLDVFKYSGMLQLIKEINITVEALFMIAFLLGFGTGRIITPAGIIMPIFLTKFGPITPVTFALLYFSIILGYIITPVHPCVSLSIESFKTNFKDYLRATGPPTIVGFAMSFFILCAILL